MNKAKSIVSNSAPLASCAHRKVRNRTGANGADIASPVRCEIILATSNEPDIDADQLLYERNWQGDIPRTLLRARDGSTMVIEGPADLAAVRAWLDGQHSAAK